jgi:hypothetical protein
MIHHEQRYDDKFTDCFVDSAPGEYASEFAIIFPEVC